MCSHFSATSRPDAGQAANVCFAINVDNIPSNRIEEGDISCILNKLEGMDKKLDTFPCQLVDSFDKHNAAVPRAPVPPPAINLHHGGPRRGPGPVAGTSGNLWFEMVKTPRGVDDTGGKAGESGDVDSDNHMSCDDFHRRPLQASTRSLPPGCRSQRSTGRAPLVDRPTQQTKDCGRV